MESEFPYQLVAFLDTEPALGETVYSGENGWYPQVALKRRFKVIGMSEQELIEKIIDFSSSQFGFAIQIKGVVQPEDMPVKVLEIDQNEDIMGFHADFIEFMGEAMVSKFPERDGVNYFPHVTVEYGGEEVVDETLYSEKEIMIEKIYLLKDVEGENSIAYKGFNLR